MYLYHDTNFVYKIHKGLYACALFNFPERERFIPNWTSSLVVQTDWCSTVAGDVTPHV